MEFIAHRIPTTEKTQSVLAHLTQTAVLAAEFATPFAAESTAYQCGILHDIGKYSQAFQRRIRGAPEKVDHSTYGAEVALQKYRSPMVAFCVAGHHSGLPDGGSRKAAVSGDATFWGRMQRAQSGDIEDSSAYQTEVNIQDAAPPQEFCTDSSTAFFFTRMLYSCLVDADYLDTEAFMSGGSVERQSSDAAAMSICLTKLKAFIAPWWPPKNPLNEKRCEILMEILKKGSMARGLFSLTVPTGGGKTVSSMAFALQHAKSHGLRRVIYVIPYTSIIEQTQDVFNRIFGAENVVAHYANTVYDTKENGEIADKRYLAAENWDAPIIVTTAVQFFESLFSNRSSRCRKLHNIANSVLVFDEAQMLPVPYLKPCVWAMTQLVEHYHCSAVLCTATQPSLDRLFCEMLPAYPVRELCTNVAELHNFFSRVTFQNEGILSDEALMAQLNLHSRVLCIVNNRKQAQALFAQLAPDARFHLSTTMTPEHRRSVLAEIRQRLQNKQPCRTIATSLVEAGVDIDFPSVYRAIAGLDSMIQAAGRCNREGKEPRETSIVHLFESAQKAPEILAQNIAAARHVMQKYTDITSPEAVKAYFELLYYTLKGEAALDQKQILAEMNSSRLPFESIARQFKLIESAEYTLYIPRKEGKKLTQQLRENGPSRALLRALGQFSVGVYPWHFKELYATGAVELVSENTAILLNMQLYQDDVGLVFGSREGQAFFA
ncbi:MAG: CRISPR-associated helicase Cas3' [Ruthenibacterium sp.]